MIHQHKLGGLNIVLDICSGSVHAVDEVAYDMIALFESTPKAEILHTLGTKYPEVSEIELAECYDDIVSLKAAGKLFVPDTFEPQASTLKQKTAGVVKALCLHIAHDCNLACRYCFAEDGERWARTILYEQRRNIEKIGANGASSRIFGGPVPLDRRVDASGGARFSS